MVTRNHRTLQLFRALFSDHPLPTTDDVTARVADVYPRLIDGLILCNDRKKVICLTFIGNQIGCTFSRSMRFERVKPFAAVWVYDDGTMVERKSNFHAGHCSRNNERRESVSSRTPKTTGVLRRVFHPMRWWRRWWQLLTNRTTQAVFVCSYVNFRIRLDD